MSKLTNICYLSSAQLEDLRQDLGKMGWFIAQRRAAHMLEEAHKDYEGAMAEVHGVIIKKK